MLEFTNNEIEFMAKKDNELGWDILCAYCDSDKLEKNIIQKYGYKDYIIVKTWKHKEKEPEGFRYNPWWFAINAHERNCIYNNDLKKWFIYPNEEIPMPAHKPMVSKNVEIEVDCSEEDIQYDSPDAKDRKLLVKLNFDFDITNESYKDELDGIPYINFFAERNIPQLEKFVDNIKNNRFAVFTTDNIDTAITFDTYHKYLVWNLDDNIRFMAQDYDTIERTDDSLPLILMDTTINKNLFVSKMEKVIEIIKQSNDKYNKTGKTSGFKTV